MAKEAGQAVLEYILILVITVVLITTVMNRFSRAFRNYSANLFGNYIACLIEAGELPGTASCQEVWQAFDPNNTADNGASDPRKKGENGPRDKDGGKDGSGKDGSGKDARTAGADGGDEADNSGSEGGGGETMVSGGRRRGSAFAGRVRSGRGRASSSVAGTVDPKQAKSAADSMLGVAPTSTMIARAAPETRQRVVAVTGGYAVSDEGDEETERPTAAAVGRPASSGNEGLRPKKTVVPVDRKIAKATTAEDRELSIDGLIRLLLIAVIVLVIVVFFGGQALQISKSSE